MIKIKDSQVLFFLIDCVNIGADEGKKNQLPPDCELCQSKCLILFLTHTRVKISVGAQ